MKDRLIYFISALFLISCNHTAKKPMAKANIKSSVVKPTVYVQKTFDTVAIPEDTVPKIIIPEGTIQVGEDKIDSTSKVKILDEEDYNEQDNVGPKDAKLGWKGVFHNKGNYYIRPAKIKFIKEHSEMDDDDKPEQKTGWRLKCIGKDSCFKLISGVDSLIVGPVKRVKLEDFYFAGQKQKFNYEGATYTLYTTGTKRNGGIYNCKLYMLANVKGHLFNQLLRSLGNEIILKGGGDMSNDINLEFVGDIDGDKIPDLIISGSGFSFGEDYLYLSKPAGDKAILKLVAYFRQSD